VVGKVTTTEVIVVETEIIAGVEITEVETVTIKTKEGMIGNAPNAEIATSRGEILAIDARQNGQLMLDMAVTVVETVEEAVVDTKGIAEAVTVEEAVVDTKGIAAVTVEEAVVDTKGLEAVTVVETEVVTVVEIVVDIKGIEAVTAVVIEAVNVVDTKETEEVTGEEIAEESVEETEVVIEAVNVVDTKEIVEETEVEIEVELQNPAIGVTVVKAGMGIVDHSVVATAQRLIQIIRSSTAITNHTVRPHSVQYNSFLRSSLSILNE
jgi:hypothetical protein